MTRRGLVRVAEPLFPCYIFVRCVVEERVNEIQHLSGVSKLVEFGGKYPQVADPIIEELQACFGREELISLERRLEPGAEVTVASGAFAGMSALVLKKSTSQEKGANLAGHIGEANDCGGWQRGCDAEKKQIG